MDGFMSNIVSRIELLSPEQRAVLAQRFRQKKQAAGIAIATRDRHGASFPLSHAQKRLWFLQQLEPESPASNVPGAARINGPVDIDVLRRSLEEIGRRHE